MNEKFFTRRIKATASTLRRVISDQPKVESNVDESEVVQSYREAMNTGSTAPAIKQTEAEAPKKETAKLLVLRAPLPAKEEPVLKTENAFADMSEHNARAPANSGMEPQVTSSKLILMAKDAVTSELENSIPDRINELISDIAPKRVANIFAENSEEYINTAVSTYAPEKIISMVEKMAPGMIRDEVTTTVSEKVAERLAIEMPDGLDATVARIVQEEMQGSFGETVTQKIRKLVHDELTHVLKP